MADNVGSKVSYFLVGLGVGALMGVSFAPKSGEGTRDYYLQARRRRPRIRPEKGPANCANAPMNSSNASMSPPRSGNRSPPLWMRAGKHFFANRSPEPRG